MNKSILLQSIRSVSGFLALWIIVLMTIIFGLNNYPNVTAPILIGGIFFWMVYVEYKNRKDAEDWKRFKKGIK